MDYINVNVSSCSTASREERQADIRSVGYRRCLAPDLANPAYREGSMANPARLAATSWRKQCLDVRKDVSAAFRCAAAAAADATSAAAAAVDVV